MPHRLLVVEDEAVARSLIGVALRQVGFDVRMAADGQAAVALFREDHRDIAAVLLDFVLPDGDGLTVLAALRAIDPHVRCVFVTAATDPETQARLQALGPVRVVPKPFMMSDLVEAVRAVLPPEG